MTTSAERAVESPTPGLKANVLGLFDSVVMAVAGSAPAYTIAGPRRYSSGTDSVVIWVGVGGLAIGLIPMVAYWMLGSPYFRQKPTLGSVLPDAEETV